MQNRNPDHSLITSAFTFLALWKNDHPILKMSFSNSKFKSTVSSQELIMNNGLSNESRELRRHL